MEYLENKLIQDNKRRKVRGIPPAVGYSYFQSIPIILENKEGTVRSWHNAEGAGKTFMCYDYGYIPDTMGMDGDEIDVYIGPEEYSSHVFIINQLKAPEFTEVDEWKVMLGFDTADQATEAYMNQYNKAQFYGECEAVSLELFVHVILADHPVYKHIQTPLVVRTDFPAILGGDRTNFVSKLYISKSKCTDKFDDDKDDDEELEKKYIGFDKLKAKIKGTVSNPGAVAAAIGRKKYGAKKFNKDAAKGKKMRHEKPLKKGRSAETDFLDKVGEASHNIATRLATGTAALAKALTASTVTQFTRRPERPVESTGAASTPIFHVVPVDTSTLELYKSCDHCGGLYKSNSACARCETLATQNEGTSFLKY